jgi:MOSC domain-containing protein YiiM
VAVRLAGRPTRSFRLCWEDNRVLWEQGIGCNVDLLALPEGTLLHLGDDAVVRVTGLRNPCQQINGFEPGLLRQVLGRADDGSVERKGGVMTVVVVGGVVRADSEIRVQLPVGEQIPLAPV